MKIYIIRDTRDGSWWSKKTKVAWKTSGAAKNAVMYDVPYKYEDLKNWFTPDELSEKVKPCQFGYLRGLKFSEQSRYECLELDLDEVIKS